MRLANFLICGQIKVASKCRHFISKYADFFAIGSNFQPHYWEYSNFATITASADNIMQPKKSHISAYANFFRSHISAAYDRPIPHYADFSHMLDLLIASPFRFGNDEVS